MPSDDARIASATGGGGGDPPDPDAAGEDSRSLAAEFWRALNVGDIRAAEEAARRMEPPAVGAFTFEGGGAVGGDRGASAASSPGRELSAGTPAVVEQAWNSLKRVNLIRGADDWCRAAVTTTMKSADFTACTLLCAGKPDGCPKSTHAGVGVKGGVLRLDLADQVGTLVIVCPVSSAGVKQTACFSRPTLRLSGYPTAPLKMGRWEPLLEMRYRPLVWRVLLEEFEHARGKRKAGEDRKPPPLSLDRHTRSFAADRERTGPGDGDPDSEGLRTPTGKLEEVVEAPGLGALLKGYVASSARELRDEQRVAAGRFPSAGLQPEEDIPPVRLGRRTSRRVGSGTGAMKVEARGDEPKPSAGLDTKAPPRRSRRKQEQAAATAGRPPRAAWHSSDSSPTPARRDRTVPRHRTRERRGWDSEADSLDGGSSAEGGHGADEPSEGSSGASANDEGTRVHTQKLKDMIFALDFKFTSLDCQVAGLVKREGELMDEVAAAKARAEDTEDSLGATIAKLRGRIRALEREPPRGGGVARGPRGARYVTHPELERCDYATLADVHDEVVAETRTTGLPVRLGARLNELEAAVLSPGGAHDLLVGRLRDLEERQVGKAVSIGGYTFRDSDATKLWTDLIAVDETYRFATDMKAQLVGCVDGSLTTAATISQKANAIKAGYGSYRAAQMAATFKIMYPEAIFKASESKAAAAHEGFAFQSAFSSESVFEGDSEHSTKANFKKRLSSNLDVHQRAINEQFPPDQRQHTKSNAILSAILRQGYYQAVGFLESLIPFYRLLTEAGLSATEAWDNKILTYAMSVFGTIQRVRTLSTEELDHMMVFGTLRSTELLNEYTKADWIRHPSVSAAMVFASLQRDGKGKTSANKLLDTTVTKLDKVVLDVALNKTAAKSVTDELRSLKLKNAGTWKT